MEIFDNYKNYKQFEPQYKEWKAQRDLKNAKRLAYVEQNQIDKKQKDEDTQRGKILLQAIDVMDEYSQSKAEDMEVTTEMAVGQAASYIMFAGIALSTLASRIPAIEKGIDNLAKSNPKLKGIAMFIPQGVGMLCSILASIPLIAWASKSQVGASRKGRFEAMTTDLQNVNHFAILTPEQQKQAEEKAKNIPEDKKMKDSIKKLQGMNMNPLSPLKSLKDLFGKDENYQKQREAFKNKIEEQSSNFNKPLSDKEIENAKKDQQILLNLVEKIDIASQEYSENVEVATNTAQVIALAGGGLVGWATDKITSLLKVAENSKLAKILPFGVGLSIPLVLSSYSAKIQKQAARVGRFKAKQELLKDPNNFTYVEDSKIDSMKNIKAPEEKKKPNMFKFLIQALKDNKKYTNYVKTEATKNKKYQKALEEVNLTEEQQKQAKMLQENTFKTFNKVDEKSQSYAESVEAVGEVVKTPLGMILGLVGVGAGMLISNKRVDKLAKETMSTIDMIKNVALPAFGSMFVSLLPLVGYELYITKEQKKASRIADMLAIKELQDYRNFIDYDSIENKEQKKTNEVFNLNLKKM